MTTTTVNEIGFQPVLAAGVSESLSQMRFACACRANKGQVAVRVDGVQGGQNLQAFHIFPLEQREVKILKGLGCFCGKTTHLQ